MCRQFLLMFLVFVLALAGSNALFAATTVEVRISAGSDDAEEAVNTGNQDAYNTSSDLEITDDNVDNGGRQFIGLAFRGIDIPAQATIEKAYIEFVCDETKDGTADAFLLIWGHLAPNPDGFGTLTPTAISDRPATEAKVSWEPESWTAAGQISQTVDISSVIEEIVSQNGWVPGNTLEIIIGEDASKGTFTGSRTAESYDGSASDAALLHIEWAPGGNAGKPSPADGLTEVLRDTILGWSAGVFAGPTNAHTIYLSETLDDVTNGVGGITQSDTAYDPGTLSYDATYYWRVDEANGAPDFTVFTGDIWSFTVEPEGIPIQGVTATASAANPTMGPENTVNGSGLNEMDQHDTGAQAMWMASGADNWIQYDFDKAYKLSAARVWNSNQPIEAFIGFGVKEITIEYSLDGEAWSALDGVVALAQAPGAPTYAGTLVELGGIMAQSVKLSVVSAYGFTGQSGLAEVRFLAIPVFAREPDPADGSPVDSVTVDLGWRAGREAVSHQVYLGTDPAALELVDTTTENAATVSGLDFSTTYSWSVTEVNEAEAVTTHAGEVWRFTTPDYQVVEDFDRYTDDMDAGEAIFQTWLDGFDDNSNGSLVGHDIAPFAEQTIAQSGQSMPLFYTNAGAGKSEATLDLDQNWSTSGIQVLSLAFYGQAGNSGTLYVKINDAKIPYAGSVLEAWQVWNIDLSSVNTPLERVTSLTIGVEGATAQGLFYIDDIRLYPSAPAPINEWRIAASSDDAEEEVATGTMESMTSSDLELGLEDGTILQIVGCRWAGVPIPAGATITEAWVQFSADSVGNAQDALPVSILIEGELSPGPDTFTNNIGGRPKTTASVIWDIPEWLTTHAMGPEERSPDISHVIQELVDQPGWAGQAIVLIFSDNPANPSQGTREAESFDGTSNEAPLLHIVYE